MSQQTAADGELPFGLTRFLSWISLILILASTIMLAFFIGNSARNTLLLRQQEYARLMAGNLNQQIFRRFTLPTFLAFGRIALRQSMQYNQLDDVIQSTILGLRIESLRIYGADNIVNYSLDQTELGRTDLVPQSMDQVMRTGIPAFEILTNVDPVKALFMLNLPDGSYSLRTLFPLTVDLGISDKTGRPESLVTGVLEITQDITSDYDNIIQFQWLILATCLGSSVILFALLQFFIFKAERMLTARMARTRKLEAELHQNEKLVSMGRVIASIAHEIRNPLGIIRSSAELLLRRADNESADTASRRILRAVYDESCRLSQIVNDFLDYARPRVPRQDRVDINGLLDQALGFLEGEMSRLGVEYIRHIAPNMYVVGDKDLLYRAIYNILVNAYQAIEHDGVIRIRGQLHDDDLIELTFHDSGPGFPPEQLPRMLDPFFTTKDHGTGLGLPIVNTIISSHNGSLQLSNPPEGGAMVKVLLPRFSDSGDTESTNKHPAKTGEAGQPSPTESGPQSAPTGPECHKDTFDER